MANPSPSHYMAGWGACRAAAQSSGHELRRTDDSRDERANTSWKGLRERRFDEIGMPDTP